MDEILREDQELSLVSRNAKKNGRNQLTFSCIEKVLVHPTIDYTSRHKEKRLVYPTLKFDVMIVILSPN